MSEVTTAPRIALTEAAAARIEVLKQMEGNPDLMLRLGVSGGGCSGFQYSITLDDTANDDDVVYEEHGVTVVVDTTSLDLLGGTELDYVEELIGASFQFRNPNASSTCGCGSSFSV